MARVGFFDVAAAQLNLPNNVRELVRRWRVRVPERPTAAGSALPHHHQRVSALDLGRLDLLGCGLARPLYGRRRRRYRVGTHRRSRYLDCSPIGGGVDGQEQSHRELSLEPSRGADDVADPNRLDVRKSIIGPKPEDFRSEGALRQLRRAPPMTTTELIITLCGPFAILGLHWCLVRLVAG